MSSDEIEQLARQQAAMIRLCTSRATRSDLADNPAQLQSELEIDNETLALLQSFPERGLSAVAVALVVKRRHAVARLIPAVVQRLGDGFTRAFDEFASDHPPGGHPIHASDAIAFCEWLGSRGSATYSWPPGFLKCQITLLFVNKNLYKCFVFVYDPAWGMSLGLPLPRCRCLWLQWGRWIWVVTRWRVVGLQ
jgi:hypothetical protein